MVIRFLCPNGHKIHCPDEQAGRSAKCPKCGVKFLIPDSSEVEDADAGGSDSRVDRPATGDSGSSSAVTVDKPDEDLGEEEMEFLCPNGHRLHGPPSLQGQPGKCPECGCRFRVPSYDDASEEDENEEVEDRISLGAMDTDISLPPGGGDESRVDDRAGLSLEVEELPEGWPKDVSGTHPLGTLLASLWTGKPPGAVVELHLGDGEKIVSDRVAKTFLRGTHGVFAIENEDGTYTLTAVAWNSVTRIVVRGLKGLPEGMMNDE